MRRRIWADLELGDKFQARTSAMKMLSAGENGQSYNAMEQAGSGLSTPNKSLNDMSKRQSTRNPALEIFSDFMAFVNDGNDDLDPRTGRNYIDDWLFPLHV
jgi:hypothetical protein